MTTPLPEKIPKTQYFAENTPALLTALFNAHNSVVDYLRSLTPTEEGECCETDELQYLTNPPQNRCKNCGNFWSVNSTPPICHTPHTEPEIKNESYQKCYSKCCNPNDLFINAVIPNTVTSAIPYTEPEEKLPKCELCGEPMPKGEEMFKYHGLSGKCPVPSQPVTEEWEKEFVEKGADIEHTRWANWQKYLHSKMEDNKGGYMILPYSDYRHWERQIATSYSELLEQEKESDRREVRTYLPLIRELLQTAIDSERARLREVIEGMKQISPWKNKEDYPKMEKEIEIHNEAIDYVLSLLSLTTTSNKEKE